MVQMIITVNGTEFLGAYNDMAQAINGLLHFETEMDRCIFGCKIRNSKLEEVIRNAQKEHYMINMKWRLEETA